MSAALFLAMLCVSLYLQDLDSDSVIIFPKGLGPCSAGLVIGNTIPIWFGFRCNLGFLGCMEDSEIDSTVLSRELPPLACTKSQGVPEGVGNQRMHASPRRARLSQLETTPVGSWPWQVMACSRVYWWTL